MRWTDLGVVVLYLAGITWFGTRFRESQKTLKDYFLGGRTAPWWAIALSIVSAETSTLTVIGTPSLSLEGARRRAPRARDAMYVFPLAPGAWRLAPCS
jgi:solute:Na+ symporter, SSS family